MAAALPTAKQPQAHYPAFIENDKDKEVESDLPGEGKEGIGWSIPAYNLGLH
jgi:hypothetical protein